MVSPGEAMLKIKKQVQVQIDIYGFLLSGMRQVVRCICQYGMVYI